MLQHSSATDRVFAALGDPIRRSLVERLAKGPATVSELAAPLSISLSAVVQHLAVLTASGLVKSAKTGRVRTCTLEASALRPAEEWLGKRRASVERHGEPVDSVAIDASKRRRKV